MQNASLGPPVVVGEWFFDVFDVVDVIDVIDGGRC